MRNALIVLAGMAMLACGGERAENLSSQRPETYGLCQSPDLLRGVSLKVRLDTMPGEQLQLRLWVHNRSSQALNITPAEATLLTDDERRQLPILAEDATIYTIPTGSEQELVWQYQPVNDLYLYQRSGLSGSLQQQYRLPLSFISGWSDTLSFCFSQQAFLHYKIKAEQQRPQLFRPSSNVTTREAAARQEIYWNKMARTALLETGGSAYFSDQEFFSSGVNLRNALFARGDSLYLSLQIINHSPHVLQLQPGQIRIATNKQQFSPHTIAQTSEEFLPEQNSSMSLRKGERLALMLVYPLPEQDSLLLQLQGLQIVSFGQPLFGEDFLFVKE